MTPPSATTLANPRRTTLAALRGTRCQVSGPGCRGTATRLETTADGQRQTCSACATS